MRIEVDMLSQLRHNNIVPILAVCWRAPACIVYPLMVNRGLDQHLSSESSRRRMSSSQCISIMADAAAGLAYLHTQVTVTVCIVLTCSAIAVTSMLHVVKPTPKLLSIVNMVIATAFMLIVTCMHCCNVLRRRLEYCTVTSSLATYCLMLT
jgi:serine/threonine protein kinase